MDGREEMISAALVVRARCSRDPGCVVGAPTQSRACLTGVRSGVGTLAESQSIHDAISWLAGSPADADVSLTLTLNFCTLLGRHETDGWSLSLPHTPLSKTPLSKGPRQASRPERQLDVSHPALAQLDVGQPSASPTRCSEITPDLSTRFQLEARAGHCDPSWVTADDEPVAFYA